MTIAGNNDFSRFEKRSSPLRETPRPFGDRVLNRLILSRFFPLIVSFLGLLLSLNESKAQISNELYFDTAIASHLEKTKPKFGSTDGFLTEKSRSQISLDSTLPLQFFVEVNRLEFERLDQAYRRTLMLVVEHRLGDSAVASYAQQLIDTIPKSSLHAVRKTRYPELKGNDPRWAVRLLFPAAIIVSGITGIISLFYIRST